MTNGRPEPARSKALSGSDHFERPYFGRQAELETLANILSKRGAVAEVIGPGGIGKTTLVSAFVHFYGDRFLGGIETFHGYRGGRLSDALDELARAFRGAAGPVLFHIDDAELMDPDDAINTIRRLETGPWDFRTITSGRLGIGLGTPLILGGLGRYDFEQMVRGSFGEDAEPAAIQKLWEDVQGSPLFAELLLNSWRSGQSRSIEELGRLLEPIALPGLLGADGRPIRRGSALERPLIQSVKLVSGELLRHVAKRPDLLFQLEPRQFEEFAAELFQRQGFEVTLTQQTRDGGKDLYLAKSDSLGSFRFAVECKRHAPDNPVRVDVIRSLQGVVSREMLTAGIVLTTSHFTRDAIEEARQTRYRMSLRDFTALRAALEPFS